MILLVTTLNNNWQILLINFTVEKFSLVFKVFFVVVLFLFYVKIDYVFFVILVISDFVVNRKYKLLNRVLLYMSFCLNVYVLRVIVITN